MGDGFVILLEGKSVGRRNKKGQAVHGWLVLDKPYDMGSTKAVAILKRLFDAKKVGHAGTLDPLATGVLPIAFGEATKTVPYAMDDEKSYSFTVQWGVETSTDDAEGEAVNTSDKRPTSAQIEAVLAQFIGQIDQVPPKFSAIKVNGQRAYKLAREGEDLALASRKIDVFELIHLKQSDHEHSCFEIKCGKGTYIRSIARDMGRVLGCFGHVSALRRTRVGSFLEKDTISLEFLEKLSHSADDRTTLLGTLLPVQSVLDDIPALTVDDKDAARLKNGQTILIRGRDAPIIKGTAYVLLGRTIIALGEVKQGIFQPTKVFNI